MILFPSHGLSMRLQAQIPVINVVGYDEDGGDRGRIMVNAKVWQFSEK